MNSGSIESAEFFEELDAAYHRQGHLMWRKLRLVERVVRPGARLLDIGCGTGEALIVLTNRFRYLAGVDVSSLAVRYAQRRSSQADGADLVQSSALNLCFRSGSFDCCLLLDVLEHLLEPSLALSQVALALRTGGQLVVTVPNWTNWVTARFLGLNPEHCTFHTPQGWRRLVEGCGFQVQLCRAVRVPLWDNDSLATRLPFLGMCILLVAERMGV